MSVRDNTHSVSVLLTDYAVGGIMFTFEMHFVTKDQDFFESACGASLHDPWFSNKR